MTVVQSLTTLMNAARNYYQVNRKLGIHDLTNLLRPAPNLLDGTDDFSNASFTFDDPKVVPSETSFAGLKCYRLLANAGGYGTTIGCHLNPGTYVFSFFLYCDVDDAGNNAVDVGTNGEEKLHQPFAVKKGWHRYSLMISSASVITSVEVTQWVPSDTLVAGYKLEAGNVSTPYLRKDGVLVKAPEISVGG